VIDYDSIWLRTFTLETEKQCKCIRPSLDELIEDQFKAIKLERQENGGVIFSAQSKAEGFKFADTGVMLSISDYC
jgi:hypothetical protein